MPHSPSGVSSCLLLMFAVFFLLSQEGPRLKSKTQDAYFWSLVASNHHCHGHFSPGPVFVLVVVMVVVVVVVVGNDPEKLLKNVLFLFFLSWWNARCPPSLTREDSGY